MSSTPATGSKVSNTYRSKVAATGAIEKTVLTSSTTSTSYDVRWRIEFMDKVAIEEYAKTLPLEKETKVKSMLATAIAFNKRTTLAGAQSALSRFIDQMVRRSRASPFSCAELLRSKACGSRTTSPTSGPRSRPTDS